MSLQTSGESPRVSKTFAGLAETLKAVAGDVDEPMRDCQTRRRRGKKSSHRIRKGQKAAAAQDAPADAMYEAAILNWFSDEKSYGFVTVDATEEDVFVHVSAMERGNMPPTPAGAPVRVCIGTSERDGRRLVTHITTA